MNVSNELNLLGPWVHPTLQEVVSRGALLRQQKPRYYIDNFWNNRVRYFDQATTSTASRSLLSEKANRKPRKLKRTKSQKRCPFRVAVLAAPTKRQCIESWRCNSRVLPIIMVDRLRQRVMDEKPIVQITDAITSFKRRKKLPKNRSSMTKCLTNNGNRMREIKVLSAIFGFRITVKLLRPLSLSMNPRLNAINNVVKEEIGVLLRNTRKMHQKKYRRADENIIDEMSRKITLWIDNILLDTNDKLLAESLRELEEEEGPVLDFIDDLMDRVADISEPYFYEASEKSSDKISKNSVSVSTLSLLDSSLAFSEESVKLLIEEIYRQALDTAERQKYDDSSSFVKVANSKNEIGLTMQDINAKNFDEDYKKLIEIILGDIVENLIINKFQQKEKLDESHNTEVDLLSDHNNNQNAVGMDLKSNIADESDQVLKKDILDNEEIDTSELLSNADENKQLTSSTFEKNDKDQVLAAEMFENDKVEDNNDLDKDQESNTDKTEDEFIKSIRDKDKLETKNDTEEENGFTEENKNNQEEIDGNITFETKNDTGEENGFTEENKNNQEKIDGNIIFETKNDAGEENGFTEENKNNQEEIDGGITFVDVENGEKKLMPGNSLIKDKSNDNIDSSLDSKAQKSADDDSEDKKVKFSDIDMGPRINSPLPINLSVQEILQRVSSRENYKTDIDLAPPNNNLLSDADESWPQHVPLPTIKVTESVNKSVTSLGNILEADEHGLSTESSYDSVQVSELIIDTYTSMSIDTNKIKDTLIEPFQNEKEIVGDNNNLELNEHEIKSKRKNAKKELHNKKLNKSDHIIKNTQNIINSKSQGSVKVDTFSKTKNAPRKNNKEIKDILSKENNKKIRDKMSKENNLTKIKKQTNVPKEIKKKLAGNGVKTEDNRIKAKPMKKEKTLKSDFRKRDKVLNDAGHNKERKNITYYREKSSTQRENKVKKIEKGKIDNDGVFKWCKGLENVINNLETWNAWMNSTCSCIKYLKQKGTAQSSRSIEKARKKWQFLHKSIQQDRILWEDTKRCNREGLMSYKKYYYESYTEKNKCDKCDCSNI